MASNSGSPPRLTEATPQFSCQKTTKHRGDPSWVALFLTCLIWQVNPSLANSCGAIRFKVGPQGSFQTNNHRRNHMNIQSYERITERIVTLLEQGTVPWHKPWKVNTGLPRNLISKKPYRGINVFLLMAMSYESPHWLTFRQAIQLGGNVKKGEKSCPVVFWKRMKKEDEESDEPKKAPLLRLYHVFNVAQCEGLKDAPGEVQMPVTKPAEIVAK